jgi:signal transduction histidine kinase
MRGLVYDLRPKSLASDGLAATLRQHVDALSRTHGVRIGAEIDDRLRVTDEEGFALLRIAQEALHNAIRHAPGAPIALQLLTERAGTRLVVQDSGPGFDRTRLPRTERHVGLASMRERAAAVHGSVQVRSAPGEGTTVTAVIPATRRHRSRPAAAETPA